MTEFPPNSFPPLSFVVFRGFIGSHPLCLERPHILHIWAFMGLEDLRQSCICYRAFPHMVGKWRNRRPDVVSCLIFKE